MNHLPEKIGPFKLYAPHPGDNGWALSYGGAWLPGTYADRDAALIACGYVLGGEGRDYLEAVRDRVDVPITVTDLTSLESSHD